MKIKYPVDKLRNVTYGNEIKFYLYHVLNEDPGTGTEFDGRHAMFSEMY